MHRPPPRSAPELLAPAGGPETAWAALQYGADAIYLGLGRFSARADAVNFGPAELAEVVGFAHQLQPRRRVYAALNTLVLEAEIPEAMRALATLEEAGVDAVIVQDAGVVRLARAHFPGLRLHGSTQMAVHNAAGARVLRGLGLARVTLARELALDEIAAIAAVPGIETEAFVHGALCYSWSGLCLFCSHESGRSGNRGRCAYGCRAAFEGEGADRRLPFSMKDLALAGRLDALRRTGVTSLKIEGRMKGALYVAAVTDYYRRRLDGRLSPAECKAREEDIRTIFSRPWTEFQADGPGRGGAIDPKITGHRGATAGRVERVTRDARGTRWLQFHSSRALEKHDGLQVDLEDSDRPYGFAVDQLNEEQRGGPQRWRSVVASRAGAQVSVALPADAPKLPDDAPVYVASSQEVKRRYRAEAPRPGVHRPRLAVDLELELGPAGARVTARAAVGLPAAAGVVVEARAEGPFGAARTPEQTAAAATAAFARMGDTGWRAGRMTVKDPSSVYVPMSVFNELRREIARRLDEAWALAREERIAGFVHTATGGPAIGAGPGPEAWSLRVGRAADLSALADDELAEVEIVFAPADGDAAGLPAQVEPLAARFGRDRVRIALPALVRGARADRWAAAVASLRAEGWTRWEIANWGGWDLLGGGGADVTTDWPLYSMNGPAIRQWMAMGASRCVLSPEDHRGNLAALLAEAGGAAIVPVFQHTPLFVAATPADAGGAAGGVQRNGVHYRWTDATRTVLTCEGPFCLAARLDELREAGAQAFRIDFGYSPPDPGSVAAAWRDVRAGRMPAGGHEGNFERGFR